MEDKITSIVSRKDIIEDAEVVIAQINRVYSEFQKVRTLNITLQNAGSGKEVAAGVNNMTTALNGYNKTAQEYVKARQAETVVIQQVNKAAMEEAKTLEQNIRLRRQLQNSMESYKASQKEDLALLKNGTIAKEEYNKRINEGQVKIEQYKARIAELNKEIKGQALTEKQLNAQRLSDQKILKEASNEYKQLSLAYNEAALRAKNYSLVLGANHPITIAAVSDAKKLGDQLKAVDASVGQNQRNVGNYSSAITGFFSKVWGGLRTVAHIIPGLGIAGLIAGITSAVGSFAAKILEVPKALNKIRESQRLVNEAIGDGGYKEAVKNVKELTINIDLARKGFLDKKAVLSQYNETLGDSIGKAQSLDEAEQLLVKNGDAYIQMTLYKAAANLALQEAAQKALERQRKLLTEGPAVEEQIEGLKNVVDNPEYQKLTKKAEEAFYKGDTSQAKKFFAERDQLRLQLEEKSREKRLLGEQTLAEEIAQIFTQKYAEIAAQFKINPFGGIGGKEEKERLFKAGDDIRKANYEIQKRMLEDDRDIAKQIYDDEQISFDKRALAAEIYNSKLQQLQKLQYEFELADINIKEAQDKAAAQKEYKIQEEKEKALEYIKKYSDAKRKELETKYNSDIKAITTSGQKEYLERYKKFTRKQLDEAEKHLQDMQDIQSQELSTDWEQAFADEDSRFAEALGRAGTNQKKREKAEKEHNDRKLTLQTQYQIESLKQQITFTEEQLAIDKVRAEATGDQEAYDRILKAEAKLGALRMKIESTVAAFKVAKAQEAKDGYIQTLTEIEGFIKKFKEIAQTVGGVIGDFISAGAEREKNAIQEQMDLIDQRTEKEIAAAEQTSVTEEEKAAKIATINARAAAQKAQLEIKQRQAEERNARFQKALNVTQAIADTSLAVLNQLKSGDPLTAIGRAIAVGAIGAARIAAIIATPIPRYFRGRDENDPYEGPALVDDGGRPEAVVRKTGEVEIGGNKPRITWMNRGDIVLPDARKALLNGLIFNQERATAPRREPVDNSFEKWGRRIDQGISQLNRTVKNKKEFHPIPLTAAQKVIMAKKGNIEYYRMNGFDVSGL